MLGDAAPVALGIFLAFASYVNLNDPDWALWSTVYALGAVVCLLTTASSLGRRGSASSSAGNLQAVPRWIAPVFSAVAIGLAVHSALLTTAASPVDDGDTSGKTRKTQASGTVCGILSIVVAAAAVALGVFLPTYLKRVGIVVPNHCGGGEL